MTNRNEPLTPNTTSVSRFSDEITNMKKGILNSAFTVRRLSALLISAGLCVGVASAATVTRTSASQYDAATGLLTKEIIEPANSNLCLVKVYTYDAYGNRNGTTTRNCDGSSGEVAAPTGSAVIASRTESTTYDSTGRFPQTIANALSQNESRIYDAKFDVVTSQTDINAQTSTWQYDSFGRKTLETRADGTKTRWTYSYCSGVNGGTVACPTYAKYVIQITPLASDGVTQNGPWTKIYFNALEREVRTETQGFDGTSVIIKATEYTSRKEVYRTSRPYYSTQSAQWTSFTYDTLSRVTAESYPDSSQITRSYNGLTTAVTYPLSRTKTTLANSQGQTVRITDANNKAINYQYDPFGNLTKTTDPLSNIVTITYDVRGNRISITDPDLGMWSYVNDALGQNVSLTDAKAQSISFAYDKLGRMTQRSNPDLISTWVYDSCTKGIGKLCVASTSTGFSQTSTYDSLGRPSQIDTQIDAAYSQAITFDAHGRVATRTYPTGHVVKNVYTSLGYLAEVRNGDASNALYWQTNSMDAEGHLLQQTFGNGVVSLQAFNATNGRLTSINTGPGNAVQNFTYQYDLLGNITTRTDGNQSLTETFLYDNLNRLTSSTVNSSGAGVVTTTHSYNDLGNITARNDLGTYSYSASGAASIRPHAVTEIALAAGGKRQYGYDANGNLVTEIILDSVGNPIAGAGRTLAYTSFNMPSSMSNSTTTSTFNYGADMQRVRQISTTGGTTIYLHPDNAGALFYEKEVKPDSSVEHRHFINAGGNVVAMLKQTGSGTTLRYMHRDNLNSTTTVTDELGAVVERLAYEPFGKRRFVDGETDPGNTVVASTTERGFTNHEHLDELGLIHMNGRVYDPLMMRFTSADPTLPNVLDLQSYNRYAYTRNNPLRSLDPSGFTDVSADTGRANRNSAENIRPLARFGGAQPVSINSTWPNAYDQGTLGQRAVANANTGDLYRQAISPALHGALTVAGAIPVAGVVPDVIDYVVTAAEVSYGYSTVRDLKLAGVAVGMTIAPGVLDALAAAAKQVARNEKRIETAADEAAKEGKTLFHYTDAVGAKGIAESGIIRADAKGRVFLTDQRLSPAAVKDRLFIGRSGDKGSHVVEIQSAEGLAIRQGKNTNELIHQGSIRDGRQGTFKVKANE